MKYSLREVFGLESDEPTPTRGLMESCGVSPVQIEAPRAHRPTAADAIREAIETGMIPQVADNENATATNRPQRDDLALLRWREMAGLGSEGGSS